MIKTILIDDEPLASSVLREYLEPYPQFEILAVCQDGFQGLKAIQAHQPDLIFLDVQMPKITGFEMLELLEEPPAVIFTTAFDQYALKAFDAMAVDYLLKPFSTARFAKAIEKYLQTRSEERLPAGELGNMAEKSNRLVVRVKNEIKIIPTREVSFFEAEDDYIAIHCPSGKYLKKMTMKSLEEALDPSKFVRVHRSFLVNLNEVSKIEPYERDNHLVLLRGGEKVPVSKTGYGRLRQVLGL
ncbi:LytTR family transcriptional regulator DNA-binding domain-containing protein [Algoriphagus halophytocola]|uniref:LytTR family transcriptional regulator DNA-binding domain-containing protein n=1 Tax=Algoriphagus halophytocola TaxID=2991499 RepID=A0ABY6MPW6_9BACT|nr:MULTISPECIES: LytTR family transcriptional regulator DNA-binding domain-containing protein [unclassified Algoriphagus]UZD24566.1 LytTR family transcriptional regulator DNA-binding domain-containing protein [Algoriphagus sp. TR-M5]WBL41931.1 LytTR family transcriptional regulator DNA-binding domain-containing protein [Algoriphagus sp. TR-M9]